MNKLFSIAILFSISALIIAEDDWKDNFFTERSTSFGLMSEKLGTDFFNFSWTTYKEGNDEIFISIGPSVFIPVNAGIGWKRYFNKYGKNNKLTPFSCFSTFSRFTNKMSNNSGDAIREDMCIGLSGGMSYLVSESEKRNIYINVGVFFSYDFRNKPFTLPVINIEFKR